jgi:tRNA nucleotidyltransferase (CCA-adding enzyme)
MKNRLVIGCAVKGGHLLQQVVLPFAERRAVVRLEGGWPAPFLLLKHEKEEDVKETIERLVALFAAAGGRALLVGGAVVDLLQNRQPKDWDIEVYGLPMSRIEELLVDGGFEPKTVGREFGILKLDSGIDVSVPRRENRVGKGHRDFDVECDPTMTPAEAAKRRDLTINSLAMDTATGEIIDHWGGLRDLETGMIAATDPETFVEDPLRVLRIMQLLPRKGRWMDALTMGLCVHMVDEFETLASERVFAEWEKLLMLADKPSVGLEFLRDSGWLVHFPELADLVACQQHPEWHPEGDAWRHTLAVVDNAARVRDELPEDWQLAFMFAALLHDVGKPSTTLDDFTSHGHDRAGAPLARTFMERLTGDKKLIEKIESVVGNHMQPGGLQRGNARAPAWRRLHNKVRLDVLGWLSRCDWCAKPGRDVGLANQEHEPAVLCWDWFREFGTEKIEPLLQGRDLIAAGHKPGPAFGKALAAAYEAQLDGVEERERLMTVAEKILS